jgi:hypothetical protein
MGATLTTAPQVATFNGINGQPISIFELSSNNVFAGTPDYLIITQACAVGAASLTQLQIGSGNLYAFTTACQTFVPGIVVPPNTQISCISGCSVTGLSIHTGP